MVSFVSFGLPMTIPVRLIIPASYKFSNAFWAECSLDAFFWAFRIEGSILSTPRNVNQKFAFFISSTVFGLDIFRVEKVPEKHISSFNFWAIIDWSNLSNRSSSTAGLSSVRNTDFTLLAFIFFKSSITQGIGRWA